MPSRTHEDSFHNPMRWYGRFIALASDVDWNAAYFVPNPTVAGG